MKRIKQKLKFGYIRWLISHPQYCHNRAIEMGELYGVWTAEQKIASYGLAFSNNYGDIEYCIKMAVRYLHKMERYSAMAAKLKSSDYDKS